LISFGQLGEGMLHPMRDDSALRTAIGFARRTRILDALVAIIGLAVVLFAVLGLWPLVLVTSTVLLTAALLVILDQRRHSGALWRMLAQREREVLRAVDTLVRAVDTLTADQVSSKQTLLRQDEALRAVNATVTDIASDKRLLTKQVEALQAVTAVAAEVALARQALDTEHRYQLDERRKQQQFRHRMAELTRRQAQEVEALLQLHAKLGPQALMQAFGQWPLEPSTVLALCSLVQRYRPALVLELGAGASTIWLGQAVASSGGGKVVSLEHRLDRVGWANEMINVQGMAAVCEVRHVPLTGVRSGDESTEWYDPELLTDLKDVDFVVVNGPIGDGSSDGRYPALPMLLDRLTSGALIALADVDRPGQPRTADRWLREHPEVSRAVSTFSNLALLRYDPLAAEGTR
jgi:predicted O-methyltransferase YrrM